MSKIVLEDFNEGDGYYKVFLAYLTKEQVEEIEALVSRWGPTDEDIKNCIGMCLTDVNEQRFKDYGTNLKDCLAWLEKQGEQKSVDGLTPQKAMDIAVTKCFEQGEQKHIDKVEPQFKVGDWITSNYNNVAYIESISDTKYNLQCKDGFHEKMSIEYIDRNWHLWTIQDAEDGDVLAVDSMPFIYNGSKNEVTVGAYCGFNAKHKFSFAYNYVINQNITPATKEQRELLFSKMKEAGYKWDDEKKELRKYDN